MARVAKTKVTKPETATKTPEEIKEFDEKADKKTVEMVTVKRYHCPACLSMDVPIVPGSQSKREGYERRKCRSCGKLFKVAI